MAVVLKGLHVRKQVAGMDRRLFAAVAAIGGYVVVFSPFSIPVRLAMAAIALFIFYWLRLQNKREPDLVPIYIRYTKQADWYEPWPQWKMGRYPRPIGFGDINILK